MSFERVITVVESLLPRLDSVECLVPHRSFDNGALGAIQVLFREVSGYSPTLTVFRFIDHYSVEISTPAEITKQSTTKDEIIFVVNKYLSQYPDLKADSVWFFMLRQLHEEYTLDGVLAFSD